MDNEVGKTWVLFAFVNVNAVGIAFAGNSILLPLSTPVLVLLRVKDPAGLITMIESPAAAEIEPLFVQVEEPCNAS